MATPAQKRLVQKRLADIREANTTRFKWPKWTGFTDKTLWDVMQLLIVPLILLGVTIGFGWWQAHLADLQHQNDIKIAEEQQQEAALQSYMDDMATLLLDKKLGSPALADKAASDEASVVARAKTLTVLSRLTDPQRKARVAQFLYEAHLIGYHASSPSSIPIGSIVNLYGADLSVAENLSNANLQGASYNTVAIQFVIAKVTVTIKPTLWPKGFDPRAAGADCIDC